MSNEELKKCDGDCTSCDDTKGCDNAPKSNTMPNGEKVVSFEKEPTLVDVANMLINDENFKKSIEGASIVATRILKHANGQDAVLQIFFHKKVSNNIIVTNKMPEVK